MTGPNLSGSSNSPNPDNCSTYQDLFITYRFYDFRNIIPASPSTQDSLLAFKKVTDSTWIQDWVPTDCTFEDTGGNTIARKYQSQNVNIVTGNGESYLTLTTSRVTAPEQLCAQIEYKESQISSLSMRAKIRVRGSPGAVAGIFAYANDNSECDIEVVTREPTNIFHCSHQPAVPSVSTFPIFSNNGDWNHWTEVRFDWLSEMQDPHYGRPRTSFWIDGNWVRDIEKCVPTEVSTAMFNMWSNNGSFSGPSTIGMTASLDIAWIEMAYNPSKQILSRGEPRYRLGPKAGNPIFL